MTNSTFPPPPPGSQAALGPPPLTDEGLDAPTTKQPIIERPDFGRLAPATLGLTVAGGVIGNISLQAGTANVAGLLGVALAVAVLWSAGALRTQRSQLLALGAITIAMWLPIRASGWLAHLNSWTALALIVAATIVGSSTSMRLSFWATPTVLQRLLDSWFGTSLLFRSSVPPAGSARTKILPVLRGLALAAIPVVVLGALLADADVVFASFITPRWSAASATNHVLLSLVLCVGLAGLVCIARSDSGSTETAPRRLIGPTESVIVLGAIALLFGVFAMSQLVAAVGAADSFVVQDGLTYGEYARDSARQGFFQLLIVASLTLPLLISVDEVTGGGSPRLGTARRVCGAAAALLTVVIVIVSILRLRLYTEAFGQTTLRWYSTAFAWMLGAIFAMLAARLLLDSPRRWFGQAAVAVVFATLLATNVLNPEARVAEHNLTHDPSEATLHAEYLTTLSADAWPTLVEYRERLVSTLRDERTGSSADQVFRDRCQDAAEPNRFGILGFNLSRSRFDCGAP